MSGELAKGPRGFVEHEGERLYYESYGDGPALVLTHGLGGSHAVWFQQVLAFATGFRVVTWDQRGFGRSTDSTGAPGPASAARDLAALLDALGIARAHHVGQSMGGFTALHFALAQPDRVASLVLADTSGGLATDEIRAAFHAYVRGAAAQPPVEAWPAARHPALGDALGRHDPARAFLYDQLASLCAPPPAAIPMELLRTEHAPEALAALSLPLCFVVGAEDPIFPPAALRSAAARLPGARVVEIPGTGHSPYFEAPEAWNAAVLAFLDGVAAGRR